MEWLEVDNYLYRVFRSPLEYASAVFASLFSMPRPESSTEGTTNENPIALYNIPREEFEVFLDKIFPLTPFVLPSVIEAFPPSRFSHNAVEGRRSSDCMQTSLTESGLCASKLPSAGMHRFYVVRH
jgi:hypothetical protein